ncbi:MAG: hypothetical protein Ct9H90mP1_3090 [Methanobacteriota archaeon]|nr:MAG: hypothetical protein Ct9H90mP1_3090 [Euryarchaeota archaeon]
MTTLMETESKPTALIVHENRITASRLRSIMSQRGWKSEICDDGDTAVDEYVRIKPDMVFMGLNLPTMDGHVAALEIRESDPQARVIFVVSKSRLAKANDAAYSAGAVTVLVTPLTRSDIDQKWVMMNGPIPDAPGLEDLDELYPDIEEEEQPPLPPIPMIADSAETPVSPPNELPPTTRTTSAQEEEGKGSDSSNNHHVHTGWIGSHVFPSV